MHAGAKMKAKFKRRGNRLIKIVGDSKLSYHECNGRWRLYEAVDQTSHHRVTYDAHGKYMLWCIVDSREDPPTIDFVHTQNGKPNDSR